MALELKLVPFTRGIIALRHRNDKNGNGLVTASPEVLSLGVTFDSVGDAVEFLQLPRSTLQRQFHILRIPDDFDPDPRQCLLCIYN